jgi:predicted nucleic acid-binding protein
LIVVDTSVWVAARRRKPGVARILEGLIDADAVALALPVRLELLAGVARHDRKAFLSAFGALPQLHPSRETWRTLPRWIERAADAGARFAITDLLIASLAADIGGLVWSLDRDFERMADLKLVGVYDPG